jgi:hypothetical protein
MPAMNGTDTLGYYRTHGSLTEPGRLVADFAKLPSALPDLCRFIQGVVLHSDWAAAYGVQGGAALSRDTLAVARRMALVEAAGASNLSPARRTPGTCRDFALMLCSLLRERAVPAKTRCPFVRGYR